MTETIERPSRTRVPDWLVAALYAGPGYLALWLPWKLEVRSGRKVAANPVDGLQLISLPILFGIGLLLGLVFPRAASRLGMFSVAVLPVVALVEMAKDPSSHNLFPIEFLFYALYGLLAVAGAALGRRLARGMGGTIA